MSSLPTFVRDCRHAAWVVAFALLGAGCGSSSVVPSPPPPPPPFPPPPPPPGTIATVTVDTLTRFQIMTGWEASAQANQASANFAQYRDPLFNLVVGDLGLNRLRLPLRNGVENPIDYYAQLQSGQITDAEWRCKRYTTINDDNDPNVLVSAGFHFSEMDEAVEKVVIPIKQRLEAQGEALFLNLNYTAFLGQCAPNVPPYPHASPTEYAEVILAAFKHLQQKYNLVPDAVEVILEPDNSGAANPFNHGGTAIGQAIVATGQRLAVAGFHPTFTAPSNASMSGSIQFFDELIRVPGVLPFLGEIAYHRYGGVSDANLTTLGERARTNGIKSAMLEHIGSGVEDLYKDLLLAGASAWQQFTVAFSSNDTGGQYYMIVNGQPVIGDRTRYLRQYFRYIRLGAQRVGATSNNGGVRPLAFVNANGRSAVVIHSTPAGLLFLTGLRPGTYGTSATTASTTGTELGDQIVGPSGTISVTAPAASVLTVYRK